MKQGGCHFHLTIPSCWITQHTAKSKWIYLNWHEWRFQVIVNAFTENTWNIDDAIRCFFLKGGLQETSQIETLTCCQQRAVGCRQCDHSTWRMSVVCSRWCLLAQVPHRAVTKLARTPPFLLRLPSAEVSWYRFCRKNNRYHKHSEPHITLYSHITLQ